MFLYSAAVLSDPASACLNTSTLSPYSAINPSDAHDKKDSNTTFIEFDESNCNSCVCVNGQAKCSSIWCGLPNCLKSNSTSNCESHEVCVPALQESCLSPPCLPRGDCRSLERSRRVAPPKLPAPSDCWPNQATLDDKCARITVLIENKSMPRGTSVEGICYSLRTIVGSRLVKSRKEMKQPLLILLCDIKTGTNDTIEVTVVSPSRSGMKKHEN